MIELSDYLIKFLENNNIKDVFVLAGGGCMHLNRLPRQVKETSRSTTSGTRVSR